MWEACWANYLTDYFHLFLCLAIISVYGDDVIAQDLRADEMLLHFSSLGMYIFYINIDSQVLHHSVLVSRNFSTKINFCRSVYQCLLL